MKKGITAEIINPEVLDYASEEFTKLLFEFYIQEKEVETKQKWGNEIEPRKNQTGNY